MVNSICVCGAGTMGSGIAQVSALAGYHTILFDLNSEMLEKARLNISRSMQVAVDKKKLSPEKMDLAMAQILYTNDIFSCLADVFIEAIVENAASKVALFNQLAELNHSECIFATNTSSLAVSEIAKNIQNPERVIGMHFFNPAPLMKLVEVVHTKFTDPSVLNQTVALATDMGKTAVICTDSPGFIVNRVARPYYIEALRLVEENHADYEKLDRLMESTGFRMGPFRLMDLIGNDVNYAVSCSVYEQMGNPERLKPSTIQQQKVKNGQLGRKTKKGYYDYE